MLYIIKLKALLIKSLSNPSISSRVWLLFDIAFWKIFRKFQEKHLWQSSYCISSSRHPRCLLSFETARFLLEGGACFKVRDMNNIKYQNLVFFFLKIRMKHKFSLSINNIIRRNMVFSIFANLKLCMQICWIWALLRMFF